MDISVEHNNDNSNQYNDNNDLDMFWSRAMGQDVFPSALLPEGDERRLSAVGDPMNGTLSDNRDMYRMGKLQVVQRNFRFVSILGFAAMLSVSWETTLSALGGGLYNGGTAGVIWVFVVAWPSVLCLYLSLAEMASMAPSSGAIYHWVSELAPTRHQQFVSFMIGWLEVLGWQAGCALATFFVGTQIQGLIVLNNPAYNPRRWHASLLCWAVASVALLFNSYLAKKLPLLEGFILFVHVFAMFAIVFTLWIMGPRGNLHTVLTTFNNEGGWANDGIATLVGSSSTFICVLCGDGVCHMAEEIQNASVVLPRALVYSVFVSGVLSAVMIMSICMVIGVIDTVLNTPTGQPWMQVIYNATMSRSGTSFLAGLVVFINFFSCVTWTAATSRQLWAFARDRGVPFSSWFSHVPPGWQIPLNSVLTTFITTCLICLLDVVSHQALNNIITLQNVSFFTSYIVSIGYIFWRRLTHRQMLYTRFRLRKSPAIGVFVNLVAISFSTTAFVFVLFPYSADSDLNSMNWGGVVYGGVLALALLHYRFQGRYTYVGPVAFVRKGV